MKKAFLGIVITMMFGSCVRASTDATPKTTRFELTVITAADNRTVIPGADVVVIEATGHARTIGKTDRFGAVEVALTTPWRAILVCHPLFSCGALRPEDVEGFATRTIALPPIVLR